MSDSKKILRLTRFPTRWAVSVCAFAAIVFAAPAHGEDLELPRVGPRGRPLAEKEKDIDKKKGSQFVAPGEEPARLPDDQEYDFLYDENVFSLDPDHKRSMLKRIQWRMTYWTSFNYFNNGDLRSINESNELSVEETDDRLYLVVAGVELATFFPVHRRVDFRMDVFKAGFWGHDQLGGRDSNNQPTETPSGANPVNFGLLHLNIHLKPEPTRDRRADLIIGRQEFEIGGAVYRDFYQDDVLDAVVMKLHHRTFGFLDLLLIDVFSSGSDSKEVNFAQYLSHDSEKVDGFRGDVNTIRSGALYRYNLIGDSELGGTHLEGRAFYYAARYGAGNDGGADRTNDGSNGNFSDQDWVVMRGGRLNAGYSDWVRTALTYGESSGIDRKRPSILFSDLNRELLLVNPELFFYNKDVDNNGRALSYEFEFAFFDERLLITPTYFYADGGRYNLDGTQASHGFVSFKGHQMGGLMMDLNYGMHPTAYTDDDGLDDFPFHRDRRTGTEVRHLGFAIGVLENVYLKLDWWGAKDTNQSAFFSGSNSTIEQNYRIVKALKDFDEQETVILAQRRFGSKVGEEYNVGMDWEIENNWHTWFTVGVFKPGRYFTTAGEIDGAPEGSTPFVGFQMGTKLVF